MRTNKAILVGAIATILVSAPAGAQTMSLEDARAQLQQYCSQNAQRTDDAGRSWYAANCTPEALARYNRSTVAPGAATAGGILFGLGVVLLAVIS